MMEEFFNRFLKYGMFLGAIFQLVCIAAVIILPEQLKSHRVSVSQSIFSRYDAWKRGWSYEKRRTFIRPVGVSSCEMHHSVLHNFYPEPEFSHNTSHNLYFLGVRSSCTYFMYRIMGNLNTQTANRTVPPMYLKNCTSIIESGNKIRRKDGEIYGWRSSFVLHRNYDCIIMIYLSMPLIAFVISFLHASFSNNEDLVSHYWYSSTHNWDTVGKILTLNR